MIDVHTHLNDDLLFNKKDEIIKDLPNHNITKVIVPSCDKKMISNALSLIKYPCVFAALGIHPSNCDEWGDAVKNLIRLHANNPKIVAIGEIGFDLHYKNSDIVVQKEIFLQQLLLAKELRLPVVLHMRDAWDEFFEFYEEHKNLFSGGVDVHCFDGEKSIAKKLLDAGFFISLTALSVENKPKNKEMIKYLPLDRIMVETDSPYLLPNECKKEQKYNIPQNVNYVAKKVAEYTNVDIKLIDEITTNNAYTLFTKMGENNG
ncbi:MAG: TatD family hydrolase [Clostridia bacterium]|nr:TatD family hydrolase [Clostridia bacterium]